MKGGIRKLWWQCCIWISANNWLKLFEVSIVNNKQFEIPKNLQSTQFKQYIRKTKVLSQFPGTENAVSEKYLFVKWKKYCFNGIITKTFSFRKTPKSKSKIKAHGAECKLPASTLKFSIVTKRIREFNWKLKLPSSTKAGGRRIPYFGIIKASDGNICAKLEHNIYIYHAWKGICFNEEWNIALIRQNLKSLGFLFTSLQDVFF